ncbi:DUF1285 domain-containing protein [Marinomonas epiphytica]
MQNIDLTALPSDKSLALPPVHTWKPPFCGDMDLTIKANGDWIHQGEKIERQSMVTMFSRILWHEEGEYFLVTPVEKVRIQVEDAPFLMTHFEWRDSDQGPILVFFSGTEDVKQLGVDCDIWMAEQDGQEKPYISMRYGMKALLNRPVFYALAELLVPVQGASGNKGMGLVSNGKSYILLVEE